MFFPENISDLLLTWADLRGRGTSWGIAPPPPPPTPHTYKQFGGTPRLHDFCCCGHHWSRASIQYPSAPSPLPPHPGALPAGLHQSFAPLTLIFSDSGYVPGAHEGRPEGVAGIDWSGPRAVSGGQQSASPQAPLYPLITKGTLLTDRHIPRTVPSVIVC